jgi:tRNA pseudouridine38-40 synthase
LRIALGLEYDGTPFLGWQSQPDGRTVQDTLEAAVSAIAGEPVRVVCAGRTDTGVHACAQVVHFDTLVERPDSAWIKGVNTQLPREIAVLWAARVSGDFHARFSAQRRRYDYFLLNRPMRSALESARMGWFHLPLDILAMRAGAAHLIGERDFSAFRSSECQAKSPVRHISRLDIAQRGDVLQFTLEANGFLHHMVRNIVGTLVYIGKGKHAPDWVPELLASRTRAFAAPTFSPHGLYLSQIDYDARFNLPAFPPPTFPGIPS